MLSSILPAQIRWLRTCVDPKMLALACISYRPARTVEASPGCTNKAYSVSWKAPEGGFWPELVPSCAADTMREFGSCRELRPAWYNTAGR
jgi:hypothetical protein